MSTIDYKERARLIEGGYHRKVAKIDKRDNENVLNGVVEDSELDGEYVALLFEIGKRGIDTARRIYRNSSNRTYRVRKRVKELVEYPCLFLTLTFRDEVLEKTSEATRRKYVINFLSAVPNCAGYVANIDFGVDDRYTKREHYHALIACDKVSQEKWPYGNLDWERVRINGNEKDLSIRKIPRYITKLTNHAVKDSAKKNKLIFSRTNKTRKSVEKDRYKTNYDSVQDEAVLEP